MTPRESAVHGSADLLRVSTAGSVDDGKSTLIGRLLYDTRSIFQDQLEQIEGASRRLGEESVNLALLTDGLRAEREQGRKEGMKYATVIRPPFGHELESVDDTATKAIKGVIKVVHTKVA